MEGVDDTDKHKFAGVSVSNSWLEWVCVKRGEKTEALRWGFLSKRLQFQDIYWFISHNNRFQQENHMINPINVEKTSNLTNVHSSFIFNKFNTSVSILLLLPFSRYIVSNSSRLHGQASCLSLSPRVCSNSCPLSQWCHPTISSSVTLLLLLPSIFPSIRVFSKESAFWSFSFSISPSNEYSGLS